MNLKYSAEDIEALKKLPGTKAVSQTYLYFTSEFKQELYSIWLAKPVLETLKNTLEERGYPLSILGAQKVYDLQYNFKKINSESQPADNDTTPELSPSEVPANDGESIKEEASDHELTPEELLVKTGKFVRSRNGRSVTFAKSFEQELLSAYPQTAIRDSIAAAGIDLSLVRPILIKRLEDRAAGLIVPMQDRIPLTAEQLAAVAANPFVRMAAPRRITLHDSFYNEMYPLRAFSMDQLLTAAGLDPDLIWQPAKDAFSKRLARWEKNEAALSGSTSFMADFYKRKAALLDELVKKNFQELKDHLPVEGDPERRNAFQKLKDFPADPEGKYTMGWILDFMGLARSSFYSTIKNENYGCAVKDMEERDREDAMLIQKVIDYRGYHKGSRIIYMLLPRMFNRKICRSRILRILKREDVHYDRIRRPSDQKKMSAERMDQQVKPNLVKRKFRLWKSGTLFLSDVSYLKHGDGNVTYLSVVIDPVSGVVRSLKVNDMNNADLTDSTLQDLKKIPHFEDAIFHSDQGVLYLQENFQKKLAEIGYKQSMSRRGNCWDNAPAESFFSMVKTEVDMSSLQTLEEVRTVVEDYMDYYNRERPQERRHSMTPLEYEKYLNELCEDPEKWEQYIDSEEKNYQNMMEEAARKAEERNRRYSEFGKE